MTKSEQLYDQKQINLRWTKKDPEQLMPNICMCSEARDQDQILKTPLLFFFFKM